MTNDDLEYFFLLCLLSVCMSSLSPLKYLIHFKFDVCFLIIKF